MHDRHHMHNPVGLDDGDASSSLTLEGYASQRLHLLGAQFVRATGRRALPLPQQPGGRRARGLHRLQPSGALRCEWLRGGLPREQRLPHVCAEPRHRRGRRTTGIPGGRCERGGQRRAPGRSLSRALRRGRLGVVGHSRRRPGVQQRSGDAVGPSSLCAREHQCCHKPVAPCSYA